MCCFDLESYFLPSGIRDRWGRAKKQNPDIFAANHFKMRLLFLITMICWIHPSKHLCSLRAIDMDIIIGFLQKIPPFVGMPLLTKAWPLLNQSVTYKCLTNSEWWTIWRMAFANDLTALCNCKCGERIRIWYNTFHLMVLFKFGCN